MILKMLDLDEWSKSLKAISSFKIFENGRFSRTGLFSQQIFGPIRSYCCGCNRSTYRGRNYQHNRCPDCGVLITKSDIRRDTYAKIELPFDILNPMIYFMMCEIKTSSNKIIMDMLEYKNGYFYNDNKLLSVYDPEKHQEYEQLIGLSGVLTYIENTIETKDSPICEFIKEHRKDWTIKNVIVIPPGFRPCNQTSPGKYITDEVNRSYINIIRRSNQIKEIPVDYNQKEEIYRNNFKNLQKLTIDLYQYILDKLSKKNGLLRSNILGKRVDFSGRAVISPDPTLKLDECRIPYFMILEIFKPQLTTYLVNRRVGKRYNAVVNMIDNCIKNKDISLLKYIEDFCKDKVCVLNRQPTLHRLGMLGFKITPHLGDTIKIHPLSCSPYNADFDGDSVMLTLTYYISDRDKSKTCGIDELQNNGDFVKYCEKVKDNGVIVEKYKPTDPDTFTKAISPETGEVANKRITEYTVHKNIEMYKIHDPNNRFKDIWASYDHSLIIYNEETQTIEKISPKELIENPTGKYLIKNNNANT